MTREEAIKVLEKVKRVAEIYESEDVKAYNMAIELLKQEPCEDAISRQAVLNTLDNMDNVLDVDRTVENYKELLKGCYEVLPPKQKIGYWVGIDEEPHEDYECNRCGYVVSTYTANIEPHTEYKYCPNCGAKMQEVKE